MLVRSYNKAAGRCWCWQDLTLSSHGSNVYVLRRAVAAGQEELNRELQPETGHRTDRLLENAWTLLPPFPAVEQWL